jgi:endonuclease G
MIKYLLFLCYLLIVFSSKTQNQQSEQNYYPKNAKHLEFPMVRDDESVILHKGYSLVYDEPCEQAKWVAYILTKKETEGIEERGNKFIEDPYVHSGSASSADYTKSGYDRGHLAPAADMKWSETVMKESFFYSNMSPQTPSFNRGIWKKLEEKMRDWAIIYDSILIVTGPILNGNLKKIGVNDVCVPELYYKVVIHFKAEKSKGIGFIMPNAAGSKPLSDYAKTIDEVEKLTGVDFFVQFNDLFEEKLESKLCIPCWEW